MHSTRPEHAEHGTSACKAREHSMHSMDSPAHAATDGCARRGALQRLVVTEAPMLDGGRAVIHD